MYRVNRMTFCEAASSSSWIVSSKFSFFRAFLTFFGLLWVRGEAGLKAGSARWGGETSKRRGVGWAAGAGG
jgi:hypothetical protein